MPRNTHRTGLPQSQYEGHLQSIGSSSMYGQPRADVSASFCPMASSSTSNLPLPQQQEQDYASYVAGPISEPPPPPLPPPPPPPTHHRASSGAWSPQNDQQLLTARMQGLNWGQIKDAYFPSKTANACRKRHERLMDRRGADDWDNRKLQRLAQEYMSMRKEIWSGLAERTGEKWNVVEQKCMASGLKNLQSAARAASRRNRLETSSQVTGYDDDSGISGIGLTPVDEVDASYSSPEGAPSFASNSSGSVGYTFHPQQQQQYQQYQQQQQQKQQKQQHQIGALPHQLHPPPPPPRPPPPQGSYASSPGMNLGAGGVAYGHKHSSSTASSAASAAGYHRPYAVPTQHHMSGGGGARGHDHGNSPYLDPHRMSTADMGIGAIMNRPGGLGGGGGGGGGGGHGPM